jgi:hypothetical protein
VFPRAVDGSRGDICKVCDRKFFIKEIIKDKQILVDVQNEQLMTLNTQIENKRKEIYKV